MLGLCYGKEGGGQVSAYAEWKYGLITDAEYASACREEALRDRDEDWDDEEEFEEDDVDEF